MRVLVIANNFPSPDRPYNGVFNLRQMRALRELGHQMAVVRFVPWAPPIGGRWQRYRIVPRAYHVEGIPVRTLRGLMGRRCWGLGTVRYQLQSKVAAEIAAFRPEVIHVHGLLPSGVLALDSTIPYVLTAHGSDTYALPWTRYGLERLARNVTGNATVVTAVSEFVASHVRRLGATHVRVIYNGADPAVFRSLERRQARIRLNLPPDAPIVAFVGHLVREKGVHDLVDALAQLQDLRPYALFAGSGSLSAALEERCMRDGINATFYGLLDQGRLADIYAAADVFALPSYREGLPTVICEAMNVGRAVVATRVGGIPEIVRHGINGFIVEPGDVTQLAVYLRTILADAPLRDRFESAARAFAQANLTWQGNAREYDAIYRDLVEKRTSPAPAGTGLVAVSPNALVSTRLREDDC